MYPVTTITSSLLALIFIFMSIKTIKFRQKHRVSIGTGGVEQLERVIRAHGNFAEYVPFSLILLLCAEANHIPEVIVAFFGFLLIVGRAFHAYAFLSDKMNFKFRVRGMKLTFLVIICLALANLFGCLFALI